MKPRLNYIRSLNQGTSAYVLMWCSGLTFYVGLIVGF
jgi:hypothetical protein